MNNITKPVIVLGELFIIVLVCSILFLPLPPWMVFALVWFGLILVMVIFYACTLEYKEV